MQDLREPVGHPVGVWLAPPLGVVLVCQVLLEDLQLALVGYALNSSEIFIRTEFIRKLIRTEFHPH